MTTATVPAVIAVCTNCTRRIAAVIGKGKILRALLKFNDLIPYCPCNPASAKLAEIGIISYFLTASATEHRNRTSLT